MANPNKKAPKWWLIFGILFLLLGIGGCGLASVTGARLADDFDSDLNAVAYGDDLEFTGAGDTYGFIFATDLSADCSVEDSSGNAVKIEDATSGVESETSSGNQLIGMFSVDEGTDYTVRCEGRSESGEFGVLSVDLSDIFVVGGGIAAGGFFLFVGFIFTVVGIVRRVSWGSKRKKMAAGGYTPPGPGGAVPPGPGGYVPPAPGGYATPPAPGQAATPPPAPGGYATPPAPGQVAQPPTDPWGNQPQG